MDTTSVIAHLQNQFSGQLVLYVGDIAKVLGKSEKAVSNLIVRKSLPFQIKTVGGKRCVDIFQMAHWLSSDAQVAQQVVAKPVSAPKSAGAVRAVSLRSKVAKPLLMQLPASPEPAMSPMATKILKMRPGFSSFMGRLTLSEPDRVELLFLHELSEELFFSASYLASSYVATVRKLAPLGHKARGWVTTRYFDAQEPALLYLMMEIYKVKPSSSSFAWQFILKNADQTLMHVARNGGAWVLLHNSVGEQLGGLW